MSTIQEQEERNKFINKYFDCAESVIKEWIAEYIGKPVNEVFDDYKDDSDVVGFIHDNIQYDAYLVTLEPGNKSFVDRKLLDTSEDARKSCSLLCDAVNEVFKAVVSTMKDRSWSTNLRIVFSEELMAFQFKHCNSVEMKFRYALFHYEKMCKFMEENKLPEDRQKTCNEKMTELQKILDTTTEEDIRKCDEEIKRLDEEKKSMSYLHLVIETVEDCIEEHTEAIFKRLPDVGIKYMDPDKESFIDKLKKEYNIKE